MTPRTLLKLLKNDATWIKYNKILNRAQEYSTFTELTKEIENMHKARPSRQLYMHVINVDTIIDANLQDISYRSRCVEIITIVIKENRLLDSAIDSTYNYILTTYNEDLSEGIRTKSERDAVVKSILQDGYEQTKQMEVLIKIAEKVVEDIDKTSWGFKNLIELLKLKTQRENIINITEI